MTDTTPWTAPDTHLAPPEGTFRPLDALACLVFAGAAMFYTQLVGRLATAQQELLEALATQA